MRVLLIAMTIALVSNGVQANPVETMDKYVVTATGALACSSTVGYVHMNAAEEILQYANEFGESMGFMSTASERVNMLLPRTIMELMMDNNSIRTCQRLSNLLRDEYGIVN